METVSVPAPASKSLSHRTLMAAGLAAGESRLTHVLESDDTARTREVFSALGARFERTGPGAFRVWGIGGKVTSRLAAPGEPLSCFVGESGTTCRLVTAILAAGQGCFRVHGAGRMHDRPMHDLVETLRQLGAHISYQEKRGCPPLLIDARGLDSSGLPGGMASVSCDESSQYLSGLLLAAPLGRRECAILLGGSKVVSWPYVSLTLDILERFGVPCQVQALAPDGQWLDVRWREMALAVPGRLRFTIRPGAYAPGQYAVEGDWSGASYFLAAGAIGPRAVRVEGLNPRSLQGDAMILNILAAMGAEVRFAENGITVAPSPLRGIDVDMGQCPDLAPTVAALAAHAQGPTRIRGAAHLALKESDRLAAPAAELRKAGCAVDVLEDGLVITPAPGGLRAPAKNAVFAAHNDHRLAMSLSLLGLPGRNGQGFTVTLDDPACVAKSFPDFWTLWRRVTT